MPETLSYRQLNRATLYRQMLLERSQIPVGFAVAYLVGLQGQVTEGPYQALWSRLEGFSHDALTELIVSRQLLRATSMRATLHLHVAGDLIGLRTLLQPVLSRMWQSNFGKRFGSEDSEAVLGAAIAMADEKPQTAGEIGKALEARFPTAEPLAMTVLLQTQAIMVQVPPTRIWGSGHAPLLSRVEVYAPGVTSNLGLETLVRRYLSVYGPASVNDMQTWCGLTKLGAVFERLRGELVTFIAPDGCELFDLPDARLPDADTPAPVRFMPLYDNAFLGYDNRQRVLHPDGAHRGIFINAYRPSALVDGVISAGWAITKKRGAVTLTVTPYRQLPKRDLHALEEEGLKFAAFMEEAAESYAVEFAPVLEG